VNNNSRKGGQVKGLILVAGCAVVLATACTAGAFAFGCQNQHYDEIHHDTAAHSARHWSNLAFNTEAYHQVRCGEHEFVDTDGDGECDYFEIHHTEVITKDMTNTDEVVIDRPAYGYHYTDENGDGECDYYEAHRTSTATTGRGRHSGNGRHMGGGHHGWAR